MKTITYEEFIKSAPYQPGDEEQANRLKAYFEATPNMSALDMLGLNDVRAEDRLWAVLREELIPANTLHEFACQCAERALDRMGNSDPRNVAALAAKRKWLNGEISDNELRVARDAARGAAWDVAWWAAWDDARSAAWVSACAAWEARDAERERQLDTLLGLLKEEQSNEKSNDKSTDGR